MNQPYPGLKPVEDRTLRAQVLQQVVDMVTYGQFRPGQKLTETMLADQLQVSRAPLREAIRELVDRGILVSQPYKGLHVRPMSRKDLRELYSMRTALEKFAFELAWPLRSKAATQELRDRYDRLIAAQDAGDQARAIDCELAFHAWVYENAGHDILLTHWERLAPLVRIYLSVHNNVHGAHGEFRHMTTEYLECAVGESLDEMMDHIERHMNQGLSAVLRVLPAAE